jgi:adenylate kinase
MPDDVATALVTTRLEQGDARRGAILDGFPRTVAQAEAFDAWLCRRGGALQAVLYLETPRDTMIERVVDRGEASQRTDDRAEVADRRAAIFARELPPLLEYYERQGLVHRIDGSQPIDQVQREIVAVVPSLEWTSP